VDINVKARCATSSDPGHAEPHFSARTFRRAGCPNHVTPMLKEVERDHGPAKTHMFMMSVVGIIIAAITKMARIKYRKVRHIQLRNELVPRRVHRMKVNRTGRICLKSLP
jgi:hypothetical protein